MADGIAATLEADTPIGFPPALAGMNRLTTPKTIDLDEQRTLVRICKNFDAAVQAESTNRQKAGVCLRFKASDQWDQTHEQTRKAADRPCLTINRIPTFVNQVVNNQRQNRPGLNISPTGERAHIDAAKMLRGLCRAIERDSDAELAYDTGFESAVDIGWGYWRYLIEYAGDDTFRKRIRIMPVLDTQAVYVDPDAMAPEASDAKWLFVTQWMTNAAFKAEYPGVPLMSWQPGAEGDRSRNWLDKDHVRVAEYYEVERKPRVLVRLANGHVGFEDEIPDDVLARSKRGAAALQVTDEREVLFPKIMHRKLVPNVILEEEEWPGKYIPIVRVVYERVVINGKVRYVGAIERMLDPQRMYNYWKSAETEHLALAPKAPWTIAEGQDEGYEDEYAMANRVPNPVVHWRPTSLEGHPVPPPRREAPPAVPAGYATAATSAAQDMMAVTGIRFDATPQERDYDESGRALRELQAIGDLGTFHGIDNLTRSMRRGGEIMLDLLPKVYTEAQVITILGEDDKEQNVKIDPNASQAATEARDAAGKVQKIFNPLIGKYGVTVTTGPSFRTRRIEAADQMLNFVKNVPQSGPIIMDLIAKNLDWPGAEEIATRLAKTIPPNLLQPEQKDMSPQVQALISGLQQQLQQASQERAQMMIALNNQQADRAQRQDKIDKDFEAKVMGLVQKADAAYGAHVGSQLKDLAEGIKMLEARLSQPQSAGQ